MNLNKENIMKYLIMFFVVSASTLVIPTCGVLQKHAVYVGLIASSTFALIDMCYPNYVKIEKDRY
tara:strand:+ start:686 stop:880 length:195 start_codon:yes stop_codon:yes gene_type:complete